MNNREFTYSEEDACDVCGKLGAWDIYGDFLCENCCIDESTKDPDEGLELKDEIKERLMQIKDE